MISNNPSDFFVDISGSEVENIDLSGSYLEGAIIIEYNYIPILGFKDYDLIDQLWTFLIHLIQAYRNNKEAEIYFPDQPRKIKLKDGVKGLIFTVGDNEFIIRDDDRKAFISKVTDAGKYFFVRLSEVKKMGTINTNLTVYPNCKILMGNN